ncbi:MAG: UDP-4-amino-4-deoxy-L-arabinose--oxoglutarate aminotransferase [Verrucomicrobia subdivision 3 bacterium]|nr:UDP-4-amino-4-deoxy-L-arabinose--oxoglutarate aminotransferase [Limisphaerales bacterium]MCS1415833.1 UDP-4-amino-4-deoxy-L-arabinose--oxoglutarate aminotransferase [Limisphaerales bacterium]
MRIRLSRSSVGDEEKAALARVIDRGYLGMGPEVEAFEQELRSYIGFDREVVCVNTGTAALHLALQCLDIGPGDEVLVPSITYVASFQAVTATGARPVACDVTEDKVFLDLKDAEQRVTERTRAVMPVHYASDGSGIPEVYRFAARHRLRVIEDAAHAFGCRRDGQRIGADGDVVCFSFDGIKNITSGEGGAVVTGDKKLAERIRDARLLGVVKDTQKRYQSQRSWQFNVLHPGYRYHMSDLMAAVGRTQLRKIDRFGESRQRIGKGYRSALGTFPAIRLLNLEEGNIIPHIFVIRVLGGRRDKLCAHLSGAGIESGVHYRPNHQLDLFKADYRLPRADKLGDELLSLPVHVELTEREQQRVIDTVRAFEVS